MSKPFRRTAAAIGLACIAASGALAQTETYGTATDTMNRGAVPGDFPGFYGGDLSNFPVALTNAQASASILGAPDDQFLSLPGVSGTPSGSAFPGAYAEVAFGGNFGANTTLSIWELGNNAESAQVFLWTNNGSNIQFSFTRGASDLTTFDLSGYASTLASMGATSFAKVGIGGLDVLGASQGFDLDAMSITRPVPEPSTYALMLGGLGALGWMSRRRRPD